MGMGREPTRCHIAVVGLTTGFYVRYLAPGHQKQSVRIWPHLDRAGDKTVCLGGEPVGHFRGTSSNVTFALVTSPKGVSSIARRYCCQSPACSNPFSAVATCGAPEKLRLSASKSHPNLSFNFNELGGAA